MSDEKLRAMQAQEQSVVRTINPELLATAEKVTPNTEPAEQWADRMAPAMAADPPSPPEDALLAEIDEWCDCSAGPMSADFEAAFNLLQRARERIIELQRQVKNGTLPAD